MRSDKGKSPPEARLSYEHLGFVPNIRNLSVIPETSSSSSDDEDIGYLHKPNVYFKSSARQNSISQDYNHDYDDKGD